MVHGNIRAVFGPVPSLHKMASHAALEQFLADRAC